MGVTTDLRARITGPPSQYVRQREGQRWEVLGASRHYWKPVYRDGEFVPRLMLPLSLSYDHRLVDGAMAEMFMSFVKSFIEAGGIQ